jgi:hypothetical protein
MRLARQSEEYCHRGYRVVTRRGRLCVGVVTGRSLRCSTNPLRVVLVHRCRAHSRAPLQAAVVALVMKPRDEPVRSGQHRTAPSGVDFSA